MQKKLSSLIGAVLFLLGISGFSQQNIQWQRNLGGTAPDTTYSIKSTSDGGFIVAATTASTNGESADNHGGLDYLIIKLDARGNVQWRKCLGGSGDDIAKSIVQTADGGYVVTGFSNSSDGDVRDHAISYSSNRYCYTPYYEISNQYQGWTVKLNGLGSTLWSKSHDAYNQFYYSFSPIRNKNHKIYALTNTSLIISSNYINSYNPASGIANSNSKLLAYSNDGSLKWEKIIDHPISDSFTITGIAEVSDGFIFAGFVPSRDSLNGHGGMEAGLVRTDSIGNVIWAKQIGGSGDDRAYDIQKTSDGGFVLCGSAGSGDGDWSGSAFQGGSDFFLMKVDASGNIIWKRCYGGTLGDMATSLQVAVDGSIFVAGLAASVNGNVTGHSTGGVSGQTDVWLIKTSSTGTLQWNRCYGGSGNDEAATLDKTADGTLVLGGTSFSTNSVFTQKGGGDAWIIRLKDCATVALPSASAVTRCGPGTATLNATVTSGNVVDWYRDATGGDALASGSNSYVTPFLNSSTTFYAQARNTATGCISNTRRAVSVTLSNGSFNPVLFSFDTVRISRSDYLLTAASGYTSYSWNTGATGASVNPKNTGWYRCTVNGATCSGSDSVFVSLILASIQTNDTAICGGNTLQLRVASDPEIITDIDGNRYTAVNIGGQTWMQSNLNVSRFRNGEAIPRVNGTDLAQWPNQEGNPYYSGISSFINPAWCWYNGDSAQFARFGKLYNWHVIGDPRGLAPEGWRVATASDWNLLIKTLDPNADTTCLSCVQSNRAGLALKQSGSSNWRAPNAGTDNSSRFNALPGGARYPFNEVRGRYPSCFNYEFSTNGGFTEAGITGNWWTSTGTGFDEARIIRLSADSSGTDNGSSSWNNLNLANYAFKKNNGYSVRCIRTTPDLRNYSYRWSTGDTTPIITVIPTQTTTYYCTISNGIGSITDSIKISIKGRASSSTQSVTACGSYFWNGKTYLQSGTYNFSTYNAAGCDSIATLNLTISNAVLNLFAADTIRTCGSSYTLSAPTGYTTYAWNTGATARSIIINATGWYKCIAGNTTCGTDSVFISIVRSNIVNNDTTICIGPSVPISLIARNEAGLLARGDASTFYSAPSQLTDIDGNVYPVIKIGNKLWMQKNLAVRRYTNREPIALILDSTAWKIQADNRLGARCWYNNDSTAYSSKFGMLYNGYVIDKGIAPEGWHIPTISELDELRGWIGYDGGALKEAGTVTWMSPNYGATNNSGFTGLPGGRRIAQNTDPFIPRRSFSEIGESAYWWSSSFSWNPYANPRALGDYLSPYSLNTNSSELFSFGSDYSVGQENSKRNGYSIRCVYDLPVEESSVTYRWSTGETTPTITVTPTTTTIYSCIITDAYGNSCRDSVKVTISNGTAPAMPGSISGLTDVCAQIGSSTVSAPVTYTIRRVTNASSYQWTLPIGVTLVSGQGDTSITVTFSSSFSSGNLTVRAANRCGLLSGSRILTVTKQTAATPAAIQREFLPVSIPAITDVCNVLSATYRIRKVTNATSYNWTLRQGTRATITRINPPGVNDTAIIVQFASGFLRDTLSVSAVTPCSQSTPRTLVLSSQFTPPTVSNITASTGNFTPCIGNVVIYTASAPAPTSTQSAISAYRWTLPAFCTITATTGDSSSITVRIDPGFTGGTLSVRARSACGVLGTARTGGLGYLPPTPTSITASTGSYNACVGNQITYLAVVPAPTSSQRAATFYRWTRPNNTSIISSLPDSSSIILQFNAGYTGGVITVRGQTACGAIGTARSQTLTSTGCITGKQPNPALTESKVAGETDFDVKLYPNPTRNEFVLEIRSSKSGPLQVHVLDALGRRLSTQTAQPMQTLRLGSTLRAGTYTLEVMRGNDKKLIKAIKF